MRRTLGFGKKFATLAWNLLRKFMIFLEFPLTMPMGKVFIATKLIASINRSNRMVFARRMMVLSLSFTPSTSVLQSNLSSFVNQMGRVIMQPRTWLPFPTGPRSGGASRLSMLPTVAKGTISNNFF